MNMEKKNIQEELQKKSLKIEKLNLDGVKLVSESGLSSGEYLTVSSRSKDRVEKELNDFLSKDFFERSGGGIGVTRMIRAMKLSKII